MHLQASLGDVDFITGDYLAEVNIAENAQAHAAGQHPGWEQTAWDGIEQTIDLLNGKKIKVVINGGAHNPKGLAEKVQELVSDVEEFVIAIEGIQESCEGLLYMI
jgi:S-adenosylhomocysteine hydrolase